MSHDEQLCLFPPQVLKELGCEFQNYFLRKQDRMKISHRQARMMVDYVAGPGYSSGKIKSKSFALTQGSGGGYARPTKEQVDEIFNRHYHDLGYEEWDAVFDEVIEKNKKKLNIIELINLTFRDKHSWYVICDELSISPSLYYDQKRIILEQVAITASKYELLTVVNSEYAFH